MRIVAILILVLASGRSNLPEKKVWVIDGSSTLVIYGNTNVNTFSCRMDCYNENDTLEFQTTKTSCDIIFARNSMTISVDNFNCGNHMMTTDFKKALNAEKYPFMKIRFLSLTDFEHFVGKTPVEGKVSISLAGVEKTYSLLYVIQNDTNENVLLKGTKDVNFSDFQLSPPTKMMGLIQVKENLTVEFRLRMRPVEI